MSDSTRPANPWLGVLLGGAIAGIFDITYACIMLGIRGRSIEWTLQSVASGLFGRAAFDGGAATAAIGLVCHFVIAFGAATVYLLASRRIALLRERPLLAGALFGIGVYLVMNFVVLPLSAFPFEQSFPPRVLMRGFLSHAILIGIPIALAVRRYSPRAG